VLASRRFPPKETGVTRAGYAAPFVVSPDLSGGAQCGSCSRSL
jgi:hypothetical protein